jgi:lipopolysaccharide transport system permease protein
MRFKDEQDCIVTVYTPDEKIGGIFFGIKRGFDEIYESRHIIARLFLRDFISQFRQKILGYFWALLNPIFGIMSFLFLFFIGILNPGEGEIPYTLYVMVGATIWSCLPASIIAVGGGLQAQSDLVMRTRIPKIALAIGSLSSVLYSTIVSMITMAIVFSLFGWSPSWFFLLYPLLVLPIIILGASIGLVLSILGSMARDLTALVIQAVSLLMYVTPVIYLYSTIKNPLVKRLIDINPMTYLVEIPRSIVCLGTFEGFNSFILASCLVIALAIFALRIFYLLEDLVAERL